MHRNNNNIHNWPTNIKRRYFYEISGERARELLFLYGSKGEFLVRPSESTPEDYTLSIHRGTRVTHVKIPYDALKKNYRLPTGQEFSSIDSIVSFLEQNLDLLTEADGNVIELTTPVQLPMAETVVNVGRDRFFHISIFGHEAENLLKDEPSGTYLVRESSSNEGEFAISVKNDAEKIVHVRISHNNGRFRIVPKDHFRTLTDLLENYIRLPMNGGSLVKLKMALPSTRFTAATIDDRIDCLLKTFRKTSTKDGFVEEFEGLYRGEDSQMFISCKEGRRAENVRKNRYRNVVPFDHTRIKLKKYSEFDDNGDRFNNDYINANYVEVPLDPRKYHEFNDSKQRYISTQGCLEETVYDFWKMIWQENSRLIVMVTKEVERGRVKCYRYWPEFNMNEELVYGPFTIKNIQEKRNDDFIHRVLLLRFKNHSEADTSIDYSERRIYHFQILSWEDNDACPVESVLNFLNAVNECKRCEIATEHGPTIVHCSAGIGRTGTYLALDILVNRIKQKGPQCICDVQRTVRMLREQRATMVQTEAQYRFIFYVISAFMRTYRSQHQIKLCDDDHHNHRT